MKRCVAVVLAAGGVVGLSSLAMAQTHTWVGGGGQNWSNPFNWTPQSVPQAGGDWALIGGGNSVLMDGNYSLGGLTIGTGADLSVQNAFALFFSGATLTNNGVLKVNHNVGPYGTYVRFDADTTLQGSGRLTLNANPSDYNTAYIFTNGTTVVNGSGHTIDGVGRIQGSWTNQGTIVAAVSGYSLDLNCNISNSGVIRATNGAYTTLRGNITQEPGGQIVADNGTTYLYSQAYTGGSISAINGGVTSVVGSSTPSLSGVSTLGPLNIPTGSALVLSTIGDQHNGVITVNDSYGPYGTYVRFDQSGVMQGTCTLQLNANASDYNTAYLLTNGVTVQLPSTYTVQGRGRIYGNWINEGTIQTTGSGNSLDLNANFENRNIIKATNQAYLTLRGNFTQTASGTLLGDNSDLYFYNQSYSGGTATASNGGRLYVTNGSVPSFSGMKTNGPIVIPTGSGLVFATTGEALNSTIVVNESTGPYGTYVRFDQTGTLGGTGVVQLNAQPADLNTAYMNANGCTITVPPSWTVQGAGRVYGSWINESLFSTTGAGNSFDFANFFTNNGTVRASNGAYLTPRAGLQQGPGGKFKAETGSVVYLYSTSYTGGEMIASGGAQLYVVGGHTPTLSGVKTTGPLNIPTGSSIVFATTGEVHDGTLTVNSDGGPYSTYMRWDQTGTLAGNQNIILNGTASDLNTSYLNANGCTITVPSTTSITGSGRFYGSWVNNSTISTGPGGGLNFANAFTNNATVKADNGSYLVLNNPVTQGAAGKFDVTNNSVTYLYSTSYSGGTLNADATSQIYVVDGHTSSLTDVTLNGTVNVATSAAAIFQGGNVHLSGTANVNSAESPYTTYARFDGDTTVHAGARFVLHPHSSDWSVAYLNSNGGTTVFAPGSTLQGTGRLYGAFDLRGEVRPQYNSDAIGYFYSYAPLSLGSTANLYLDVRSDGVSDYLYSVSNPVHLGGTLHINVLPGYSPAPGDQYIIAYSNGRSGTFDTVVGPSLPNNRTWEVQYTSTQAILFVGCGADFNRDGFIDFSDFDEFVAAFESGDVRSDFNEDGFLDFTDFDDFVAAFEQGC